MKFNKKNYSLKCRYFASLSMTHGCHSEERSDEESDKCRYFIPNEFGIQYDKVKYLFN